MKELENTGKPPCRVAGAWHLSDSISDPRHGLINRIRANHISKAPKSTGDSFEGSARRMAREFLALLASDSGPRQASGDDRSRDIQNLNRTIAAVSQAARENVITSEEEEAMVDIIVRRFIESRLDDLIGRTFTSWSNQWFLVSREGQYTNG